MFVRLRRLAMLLAVLVYLSWQPAWAAQPDVPDRIAAAWRTDRIYVDDGLRPGFPQGELDRIRAEARTVGFPVYVALIPRTPYSLAARIDLPTLLQARIGQPGLYLVWMVTDDYWTGTEKLFRPGGLKGRDLISVQLDDEQADQIVNDRPAPEIVRTIQQAATAYDGRALPEVPASDLEPPRRTGRSTTDLEDLSAYIGLGIGALIGFVLTLFLVLRRRRKRVRRAAGGDVTAQADVTGRSDVAAAGSVGSQADRWIGKAEHALRSLESRRRKSVELLDRRDDAVRRLDVARALRAEDSNDVLAMAGAFVLARQAQQVASGMELQPPCFFDPTHPPGIRRAAWSDDVEVPACRTCANTVAQGKTPYGLRVWKKSGLLRVDRVPVPYWTLEPDDSPLVATGFGALSDDLVDRIAGASGGVR
ncbi:hypothetical protein EV643_101387 [Kribbella sp. VKM Ac-2527]|uniref:TPM domain-containing protein n=1 Tax=Kribbella caucasensis TaxID=2512215 RepID=A0A4R6KU43_9ACTN|nr:hypothetical protein [Kribbella sp. VKM Ac-2527]TDO54597.1 hypothetical protein EV643_101387 [Kribbella sp. VKM Ac-2527]